MTTSLSLRCKRTVADQLSAITEVQHTALHHDPATLSLTSIGTPATILAQATRA